ncbi:MAG: nitroreductase [Rhodocyclaceae bacterium]|nr:nitroreductase [Rhodocyclaceae bacterium]MBX3667055.1 nitroreductase [Rhodocyclaceae bacterium]
MDNSKPAEHHPALLSAEQLEHLFGKRRSVRAFLPDAVPEAELDAILRAAARSPSGNNIQPWRVHVLTGTVRDKLVEEVCAAFDRQDGQHRSEYHYYPQQFFEPYLARRRRNGWSLYGLLGIPKGDRAASHAQHRRNFMFFDAPVGLMFTIDRRLELGSWLDYGMFLQSIMLAAVARGLATCPQAAWIDYHQIISSQLGFAPHEQLVCGMAVGYEDLSALVNSFETERADLAEFVVRHGAE